MYLQVANNVFSGWSLGHQYTFYKKKEDEIKQGKNYYISTLLIFTQLSLLGANVSKLQDVLPNHPYKQRIKIVCNIGPFIAFPFTLFSALVKHGHYETFAEKYNQSPCSYIPLPKKLPSQWISFFNFFAEHTGDLLKGAMLCTSIAQIIFGNAAYGGAALSAFLYQFLDKDMQWIPHEMSSFVEVNTRLISELGTLLYGTILNRLIIGLVLLNSPCLHVKKFQHLVDNIYRFFISVEGPTLKEIDNGLIEKKDLSFTEIAGILEAKEWDFEINPVHCNQPAIDLNKLPKDTQFHKLLDLFDAFDWKSKYSIVKGKLKDDERFIHFLTSHFKNKSPEELSKNIDTYINILASEALLSKEEYAAQWLREQMVSFVDILDKKRPFKGLLEDLDEAILYASVLLPFLQSFKKDSSPIKQMECEDALLKLACEGGDYCARGIRRAANELLMNLLQNDLDKHTSDPMKNYEDGLLQACQNKRNLILQSIYQDMMKKAKVPGTVYQDTHSFDMYRLYFSLGFFPLIPSERKQIGLIELLVWENWGKIREELYETYSEELENVVHEAGEIHFGNYLNELIQQNSLLSEDQKESLIETFTFRNNGYWTYEKTLEKFHRFVLIHLGVLRKKSK